MRGKVAKQIRKLVDRDLKGQPVKEYTSKEHPPVRVPSLQLGADGKPLFHTIVPVTITLSEGCQRHFSQFVKRNYNK